MKLAIVIERIEPWRGGAETSTMELARLLSDRGHDVHLITTTTTPSPPGLTIHQIAAPALLRSLRTASFVKRAGGFLKENKFDLVHSIAPMPAADTYQPRGGLLGEITARNVATRTSASRRLLKRALMAMNVKQRAMLDLERETMREGGPVILCVSQYVARQCERLYHLTPPRARVVFNGVHVNEIDPDERARQRAAVRAEYHVDDDTLLLLFVAHNFRLKGLGSLMETASRLVVAGFKKFRLLVVGRDNPVRYQRRLASQHLDQFVTFAGPTQRSAAFFAAADVCVHPTYYDPCSRVVLEAISYGIPTITTAFNGASEVITDGSNGFVIESPEAVGLLARRIEELSDPRLRAAISEKSLALRPQISMTRHVEELDALFRELAGRK